MRVVDRNEMLRLPPGTLYTVWRDRGHNGYGVGLYQHGGACGPDWLEAELIPNGGPDGATVALDLAFGREGLFNPDIRYAVYEEDDLDALAALLGWIRPRSPT